MVGVRNTARVLLGKRSFALLLNGRGAKQEFFFFFLANSFGVLLNGRGAKHAATVARSGLSFGVLLNGRGAKQQEIPALCS